MKVRNQKEQEKIDIPMTPMIDIVFQLLVFFIMTFKVVAAEGDFNIKMPLAAPSEGALDDTLVPPLKLRLRAGTGGGIADISLNNDSVGTSFEALKNKIIGIIGHDRGPGSMAETAEVEIDADYNLNYVHTINAITAVSGYVDPNTDEVVKMVEKIKFSPPRAPQ
jgi:biopolymer transport protein ExbD